MVSGSSHSKVSLQKIHTAEPSRLHAKEVLMQEDFSPLALRKSVKVLQHAVNDLINGTL